MSKKNQAIRADDVTKKYAQGFSPFYGGGTIERVDNNWVLRCTDSLKEVGLTLSPEIKTFPLELLTLSSPISGDLLMRGNI